MSTSQQLKKREPEKGLLLRRAQGAERKQRPAAMTPNPSFNRTRYGRPPWPGRRYAVHFRQPGQGVLPPHAGYLER